MAKLINIFIFVMILTGICLPQKKLTLNDAVQQTLANNYSIHIAKANTEILNNNTSLGNSGLLPELSASGSLSGNKSHIRQEYNTGEVYEYSEVNSDNAIASISLSWTIFDGFKMFASLSRYKELNKSGELTLKNEIENAVYSLMTNYYGIVHDVKLLKAYRNSLEISKIRFGIVSDQKELGSASKFDVLQAQVDLNEDSSNVMRQDVKISKAKIILRQIMGVKVPFEFILEDSVKIKSYYDYDQLFDATENNNKEILLANQKIAISNLDISLSKSDLYPKINVNAGYGFNRAENDINQVKVNKSYGVNYGIGASLNIFDGFNISRQIENAEISRKIAELQLEDLKTKVRATLLSAYKNYTTNFSLMQLEKANLKVAEENVDIAKDKLKLGTITYLEFRKIQNDFLNAENRLFNAEYDTKISEIDLLKLSGQILN
ncbi:MAG: TolC family protein [Bacteroidota bacterium]|nr:TolC family protein [Bacteroidota bacterium]